MYKLNKNLRLLLGLGLIVFVILIYIRIFTKNVSLECNVIHEPKSGCPKGYIKERSPRFTEKDGSKEFACISNNPKDDCVDVLKPGETMEVIISIPSIKQEQKRKRI